MTERGILFSSAMVRALLDGTKTQTRRAIKPHPSDDAFVLLDHGDGWWPYRSEDGESANVDNMEYPFNCPYGKPGDRLWVRETCHPDPEDDGTWAYTQWAGCKGSPLSDIPNRFQKPAHCIYRADLNGSDLVWRPSIHMPRWASRILLDITSVRVELLQDIGEADARAEGVAIEDRHTIGYCAGEFLPPSIRAYRELWESIAGAGSWDVNPWVWVVEFKKVLK